MEDCLDLAAWVDLDLADLETTADLAEDLVEDLAEDLAEGALAEAEEG